MQRLAFACVPVFAAACLLACGQKTTYKPHTSGTLALTSDDALLYAVDSDNRFVALIDTATETKIGEVRVGAFPEQIVLGPDDTAYVANRGDRTLSVFRRETPNEVRTVPVGVEPVGLALSRDGARLFVVNAASLTDVEHGSLMAIDTTSLNLEWELALPRDPRAIALLSDQRAVVSLYRAGDVAEVDLAAPRVVSVGTGLKAEANQFDPTVAKLAQPVSPRGMHQLLVSPNGEQIYATVTWASERVLNAGETAGSTPTSGGDSNTYGSSNELGSCTGTAVATPGIATFSASDLTPMVRSMTTCQQGHTPDQPATMLVGLPGTPLQGPTAMVVDEGGSWLYVALRESDNVAILPTSSSGGTTVRQAVPLGLGAAPTGLALTSDGRTLYVHSSFRHEIQALVSSGTGPDAKIAVKPAAIAVAGDVLPPAIVEGRRLFFSASDSRMNDPATVGIACSSCHLEGRDDGHVWNFSSGPRQTPSLAGRAMSATAPFHWGGEHLTFTAFLRHTVGTRMGGTGLDAAKEAALLAFIDSMPAPDNPNRLAVPTEAQARGADVFQKAACSSCHAGEAFTNNTFADVGTFVKSGPTPDSLSVQMTGLNTPSLLGVARTAPYLHDGSVQTLRDRIALRKSLDQHGTTSALTDAEVSDLVEYLKTL
jgi:YVTN family beta-propeller protein